MALNPGTFKVLLGRDLMARTLPEQADLILLETTSFTSQLEGHAMELMDRSIYSKEHWTPFKMFITSHLITATLDPLIETGHYRPTNQMVQTTTSLHM